MSFLSKGNPKSGQPAKKTGGTSTSMQKSTKAEARSSSKLKQTVAPQLCSICSKRAVDAVRPVALGCGHPICNVCSDLVGSSKAKLQKKSCPECSGKSGKEEAAASVSGKVEGGEEGEQRRELKAEEGAMWDEASGESSEGEVEVEEGETVERRGDEGLFGKEQPRRNPGLPDAEVESTDSGELCGAHGHEFTGFCLSCKRLVCVDCIYSDHKAHDFHPLKKAREMAAAALTRHRIQAEGVSVSLAPSPSVADSSAVTPPLTSHN